MKRIVITGAGGFIGSALARSLARDHIVYAVLHREKEAGFFPASSNLIPIVGDLNNWEQIAEQISGTIDVLFHLAWEGISSAAYKDISIQKRNLELSIKCAQLAKAVHCQRFVFVGSNQEYLVAESRLDHTISKASVYGVCKLCARELCQVLLRDSMEYVAVAFTNVFGVGDYSKRTANFFIHRLLQGEGLDLIEGNHRYDWTYIDDAVKGLIAAGTEGKNGKQYYVGSRELPTFKEILLQVREVLCPEAELRFGTYEDKTYTDYSQFDLEDLYQDTGFSCTCEFRESIRKTAEWVKESWKED